MFRRRKNKVVLKSPGEIEAMRQAGRLSATALRLVGQMCAPGVTTLELDQCAEEYIRSQGAIPTFKGYGGFPGSICASINEMVVHGIPSAKTVLREGDIISIDTGATFDGWVGDNAWTFQVGEVGTLKRRLCEATEKAMWAGIEAALPGKHLGDIGHAVQSRAEQEGFRGIIREYVGHGVGHMMHESPEVPNYGRAGSGMRLCEGLVIAIEPMIAAGSRHVHTIEDGWGVATDDGLCAAHFENTVAITACGPIVLTAE